MRMRSYSDKKVGECSKGKKCMESIFLDCRTVCAWQRQPEESHACFHFKTLYWHTVHEVSSFKFYSISTLFSILKTHLCLVWIGRSNGLVNGELSCKVVQLSTKRVLLTHCVESPLTHRQLSTVWLELGVTLRVQITVLAEWQKFMTSLWTCVVP